MFSVGLKSRTVALRHVSARFNSTKAPVAPMNWTEFFTLKKQNSRFNMFSSGITAFGGSFVTLTFLGNIELDVEKPIMGLDPLMVMGGLVGLGGFAGYMFGPFLGTALFNMRNRALLESYKLKNQLFLRHIKAKRVDPSSQSMSNPVPDYYGEKIYSLNHYKQWLRDCNAFRRKSREFL
ncbi:presequence translocated-associated motor subunit Pam17p, mitochondrial [[Candida] anglica]|uniref:Presequence translocated-associated motor subunit PAM17 n=1 Tax=[Candida] anglica TaxID=148631 RepID=A0ABP0EKS0_9ASCO